MFSSPPVLPVVRLSPKAKILYTFPSAAMLQDWTRHQALTLAVYPGLDEVLIKMAN